MVVQYIERSKRDKMPELPEVHGYQTYFNSTCLNQKIVAMDCRDNRLLKKPQTHFEKELLGELFLKTERIGKYLFVHSSGGKVLVMHFGMTGRPTYYANEEDRPKFGHIVLTFDNGYHFAFENKRKFGWWNLTDDVDEYRIAHKLSKDARDLTLEEFRESVRKRKTAIKKVIMDQSVTAGVGNWMADDILYQAQIHPEKIISNLTDIDLKRVFDAMQHVIETAIDLETHYASFPEYFLIHARKKDAPCYHTGVEIKKIKVGGRTTYLSPEWQVL